MSDKADIQDYLAAFDDIPGTRIYTAKRARQGYHLNQFAMSLMKAENREAWKADEKAYLERWPMSEAQKQAVAQVLGHGVSLLTGGPGTGKSRTVAAIVKLLRGQASPQVMFLTLRPAERVG